MRGEFLFGAGELYLDGWEVAELSDVELRVDWSPRLLAPDYSHLPTHLLAGRVRGALRAKTPLWLEAGVPFLCSQRGEDLRRVRARVPATPPYRITPPWEPPPGALWVVTPDGELFREAQGQPGPGQFLWDLASGTLAFSPSDAGREVFIVGGIPLLGWGLVGRPPILAGRLRFGSSGGAVTLYLPRMALASWSLSLAEEGVVSARLEFLLLSDPDGRLMVAAGGEAPG